MHHLQLSVCGKVSDRKKKKKEKRKKRETSSSFGGQTVIFCECCDRNVTGATPTECFPRAFLNYSGSEFFDSTVIHITRHCCVEALGSSDRSVDISVDISVGLYGIPTKVSPLRGPVQDQTRERLEEIDIRNTHCCYWCATPETRSRLSGGTAAAVTSFEGIQPVATDAGAAGGMRTAADSAVSPRGWQLHFDPMHDSSQADLTKDNQGALYKNFSSHFLKVSS
ncbi:uncharacterized protein LOC127378953 [Dicentrarchus labrax]|uniref:uncharacterized protein LOC127378953 n=1 Tax=Dicentrarchus labrax TaxID=13489 RepID=UPI0021F54483|nr:uncharacterized protein LOC127378953 [Dicentrarchus labrax]